MPRRELYSQHFRPSGVLRRPYLIVAVQVIAAETDAAARRLFTTPQQRFLRLIRNQPVELLPPVDSMDLLWQEWERVTVFNKLRAAIVGSDATVKAGLQNLVVDTGADEVIAVTDTYEHAHRLESYQRVAGIAARSRSRRKCMLTLSLERAPGQQLRISPAEPALSLSNGTSELSPGRQFHKR